MFVLLVYPSFNVKSFNIIVNLSNITKDIIVNFTVIVHKIKKINYT